MSRACAYCGGQDVSWPMGWQGGPDGPSVSATASWVSPPQAQPGSVQLLLLLGLVVVQLLHPLGVKAEDLVVGGIGLSGLAARLAGLEVFPAVFEGNNMAAASVLAPSRNAHPRSLTLSRIGRQHLQHKGFYSIHDSAGASPEQV